MERLLDERETAALLYISVKKVQADRQKGIGPKFVRLGRAVRYRPQDVREFVNANIASRGGAR